MASPTRRWLPIGHDVARAWRPAIDGEPAGTWGEIFGMPMTAHFLGGCVIGASPVGGRRRPLAPGLFATPVSTSLDGSAMPANPGANPALTITALAERAISIGLIRGSLTPGRRWGKRGDGWTWATWP